MQGVGCLPEPYLLNALRYSLLGRDALGDSLHVPPPGF